MRLKDMLTSEDVTDRSTELWGARLFGEQGGREETEWGTQRTAGNGKRTQSKRAAPFPQQGETKGFTSHDVLT